jgi:hypothetical protein
LNDIVKLRELIENGYIVNKISVDSSEKGVITLTFSGIGNPIEGQVYFLITDDILVIERARERFANKS